MFLHNWFHILGPDDFSLFALYLIMESYYTNRNNILEKATSKTWTQAGPGPRSWTQALKNLGRRKIWTLQNMDPGKHEINMGLKNLSDFRKLCFIKTIAI